MGMTTKGLRKLVVELDSQTAAQLDALVHLAAGPKANREDRDITISRAIQDYFEFKMALLKEGGTQC